MSVKASTTVSISPSLTATRSCSRVSNPRRGPGCGCHQTESSRSIAASSSGVPWTLGPVNHFLAETSQ